MGNQTEDELAAWRDAERQLENSPDGDVAELESDVERHRTDFQQLSADHMMESISALKEAENRRKTAVPSTPPFHQAAKDEMAIASDIWDTARQSDEDTPRKGITRPALAPR